MNEYASEERFGNILPKLQYESVIVIYNVPYHSSKLDKTPIAQQTKPTMQNWLHNAKYSI